MDHGEDARAEELYNLRLALATFAVQLDAFELRSSSVLRVAGTEAGSLSRGVIGRRIAKGENDWASIRSAGSKSGT